MDWNDKNWKHYNVTVEFINNDPESNCLVVPSRYGGVDFLDGSKLSPFLYGQIYATQPEIFKDLKFEMTEEIRNAILMESI